MSQEASTHLIVPEASEELIANEPWSIENYADGLIDELFCDIDQILDNSRNLPSQTVQSGYTPVQTIKVQQIVVPETQIRQPIQAVAEVKNNHLSRVAHETPHSSKTVKKTRKKSSGWVGKLLSTGATIGVAIVGAIWLLNSGLLSRLNSQIAQQSLQLAQKQAHLPTQVDVQADLVQYMLRALSVIDRQETKSNLKSARPVLSTQASASTPAYPVAIPTAKSISGSLPPVLVSSGTSPAPARSTTVVERIYIPVYQAPLPMRYAPPPIGGVANPLPPVALAKKGIPQKARFSAPIKTALKTVREVANPDNLKAFAFMRQMPLLKPLKVTNAPITVRQPPKPLPVLPVISVFRAAPPKLPVASVPAPRREVIPPPPVKQEVAVQAAFAPPAHELQGVLDLPGKSAALFKIDGATRRIDVGEGIGASGWTLVEVTKDEAVVRRNGEVRSIFAGQKF
ncbi:MAG: hypothetical protein KME60_24605 [Cyanomargarita calcarea GSE-NOS-MK-12-04C]|jgi:hypothetical protein|uniref:Type II secretion system protein GspC N-terminal domain-containing protein n=1 Tax=Cyanomargarita calcarea GSE-NOS-MK-12-04C TaxID=2839659 RepID=A0A951QTF5_9CYAN|nr:hypothetical protein [Cyanomargarita calcarea GSE-NOS-MK-12-04C]